MVGTTGLPPSNEEYPLYTLIYRPDDGGPDVHIEPANGGAFDVEPLNHQALYRYTAAEANFPITLRNAVINGRAHEDGRTYTVTARISAEAGKPMYGLVVGGWVPFPFGGSDLALVDRNVVIKIQQLQAAQIQNRAMKSDPHLDLLFAGGKVSPLPYVLEGGLRRIQSQDEVGASLNSAYLALSKFLPQASLLSVGPSHFQGLLGLVEDLKKFLDRAIPFLHSVCPLISQPISSARKSKVIVEVLQAARAHRIDPFSLVVCAAMSCLHDNVSNGANPKVTKPGRAVLKPSAKYTDKDAYGALSDLIFLELFVNVVGMRIAERPVFYTHDLGLAALWSSLSSRNVKNNERGQTTVDFSFTPELLPELDTAGCGALCQLIKDFAA